MGPVFRDSFDQYVQALDPADAAWLSSISEISWQPVVMELEALNKGHKDSSATRKLLSRVRCFVEALRPFFGSIDTIVSNLQIVGLVWGALKLVIEITHKFTEYFAIISDTLETISVELPIFQDYVENLFPEYNAVQKAVLVVFEDILSVFLVVRRVFIDSKGHTRCEYFFNEQNEIPT
ncbi:hypothetical protein B0H17DRAFT_952187 [Mycena rosella]|uniref:Uncharacterized protein n=1 Tax=Mycena rosella TaxID=1033263 RepID=A0AAD7CUV4_MYCRO|nr:hypothetical protein B0H17DRAFT_952187 [Mycena rosella]